MSRQVLVCGVTPALQDACRSLLAEFVDVRLVPDVERGLEALRERPADLLVWDPEHYQGDVLELLRTLRARYPAMNVLLAASGASPEFRNETIRLGRIHLLYPSFGPQAAVILMLRQAGFVPDDPTWMPFSLPAGRQGQAGQEGRR